MTEAKRPVRFCPLCEQADDHPRHEMFGLPPKVAPHMDCCAQAGCPTGDCDLVAEQTGGVGKLKGDKLVKHLTTPAHAEALQAAPVRNFTLADIAHLGATDGGIELTGVTQ